MSEIILSIKHLSKKYCRDLHRSLHYGMVDMWRGVFSGKSETLESLRSSEFWALKDVTAELPKGESLGILGRNGSGKSTLLKILNGTLRPTSGEAIIRGSVRLLALGSGFNPILSGAENIRITCSLLGFSRKKTTEVYDEIVDFAELGEFIDAPVKTYSSGMYARLGFASAVVVNPELLLVDEALAVGDLPFVSKCLRRIHRYRAEGGSVVLVSHSGYTVRMNCSRALWLKDGQVEMYGEVNEVCTAYEMYLARSTSANDPEQAARLQQLTEVISRIDVSCTKIVKSGEAFDIEVKLDCNKSIVRGSVSITVVDCNNTVIFNSITTEKGLHKGCNSWVFHYPNLNLMRGVYRINLVVFDDRYENQHASLINAEEFEVEMPTEEITSGIFVMPMSLKRS